MHACRCACLERDRRLQLFARPEGRQLTGRWGWPSSSKCPARLLAGRSCGQYAASGFGASYAVHQM